LQKLSQGTFVGFLSAAATSRNTFIVTTFWVSNQLLTVPVLFNWYVADCLSTAETRCCHNFARSWA
jgi:hypothetical protein